MGKRLYVGNLPYSAKNKIFTTFLRYGPRSGEAKLVMDRESGVRADSPLSRCQLTPAQKPLLRTSMARISRAAR